MFGIGPSELIVIFLIALLVLGPEQLPKVARTLAKLFGEFRRATDDLRLNIVSIPEEISAESKPKVSVREAETKALEPKQIGKAATVSRGALEADDIHLPEQATRSGNQHG